MPILGDFLYHRPRELKEALALLEEYGGRARCLAGGTDVLCWLQEEAVDPAALVDLKELPGLGTITLENGILAIGALVTFTDLLESDLVRQRFPALQEMAKVVGSVGIRNRATVMGNLCSAVACCDAGPLMLTYDASVVVTDRHGETRIALQDWFQGNRRTVLKEGQIAVRLEIPDPGTHGGCFVKLGRYRGQDLAQASVAVLALPGNDFRIAFGAVAASPFRAKATEAVVLGHELDAAHLKLAKDAALGEIKPISDVRASKEYRSRMIGVMVERALLAASARFMGSGPAYGTSLI